MSLGTRTLNDTDRQPLSTADSDLKLSLGFLDSGAAAQAAAADKEAAKKTRQISGENVSKPKGPFTPTESGSGRENFLSCLKFFFDFFHVLIFFAFARCERALTQTHVPFDSKE